MSNFFNMIDNLNNLFYISLPIIFICFLFSYRFLMQRRKSEGNILKMIKEVEDKLIEI